MDDEAAFNALLDDWPRKRKFFVKNLVAVPEQKWTEAALDNLDPTVFWATFPLTRSIHGHTHTFRLDGEERARQDRDETLWMERLLEAIRNEKIRN